MAKSKKQTLGNDRMASKRRPSVASESFEQNYLKKVARLRHPEDSDDEEQDPRLSSSNSTSAASTSNEGDDYETLSRISITRADQFPSNMLKYWQQRRSLFTLFDGSSASGLLPLLDRESWYSVTPEPIAARIAQRCRSRCVLDPFCGVGGNAIQFALTCERVIAIDIDPIKIRLARHNARVYGVEEYITFLQGDCRDFARDWLAEQHSSGSSTSRSTSSESRWQGCEREQFDVVFMSPPWGGVDYRTQNQVKSASASSSDSDSDCSSSRPEPVATYYPLSALQPMHGKELYDLFRQLSPNICMFLPRTVDLRELAGLVVEQRNPAEPDALLVDVEEQWLNGHCKALSCFFGELVAWQEL